MSKHLTLSASQLGTADDCLRKWWFEKRAKLPEVRRHPDPRTLGDVLHEVVERWLSADENGRGPDGKPVDLYPEARDTREGPLPWTSVVDKWGDGPIRSITPVEAEIVKRLVAKAIEGGVIVRSPDGRVEERFHFPVLQHEDGNIFITGFRDYTPARDVVEDHKSVKKNRSPWRKTPEALHGDIQMRTYAKSLLVEAAQRGEPIPDTIHAFHNQFIKDPEDLAVMKTPTKFSRSLIESWWAEEVIPLALEILETRKAETWEEIPGPRQEGACNKYGGCPHLQICSRRETMEQRRKKIEHMNRMPVAVVGTPMLQSSSSTNQTTPKGGSTMSIKDKLAAKKLRKQQLQGVAPPPTATKQVEFPGPKPAPPAEPDGDTPPWADPDCKACGGRGVNSKGTAPCRICDATAVRRGAPRAGEFEVLVEDGVMVWSGELGEGAMQLLSEEEVHVKVPREPMPVAPEPEEAPAKKRGRPRKTENPSTQVAAVPPRVAPSAASSPKDEPPPAEDEPTPAGPAATVRLDSPAAEVAAKAPKRAGRKPSTFMLLVDCVPTKASKKVVLLADLIRHYGDLLVAEAGGTEDSFYGLDGFKRRDALCQAADHMAEGAKGMIIVATPATPEERALVMALSPLASTVIGALK